MLLLSLLPPPLLSLSLLLLAVQGAHCPLTSLLALPHPCCLPQIMKSDQDVRMISAEAPVLFARACECFILDLTLRAWSVAQVGRNSPLAAGAVAVGQWCAGSGAEAVAAAAAVMRCAHVPSPCARWPPRSTCPPQPAGAQPQDTGAQRHCYCGMAHRAVERLSS